MFSISLTYFFLIMLSLGLLMFAVLWIYYDRSRFPLPKARQHQKAYNCVKCNALYGSDTSDDKAACPNCGFFNVRLRF